MIREKDLDKISEDIKISEVKIDECEGLTLKQMRIIKFMITD